MSTPIIPNGRMSIKFVINTLTHTVNERCVITNPGAGSGYLIRTWTAGTISWNVALGDWLTMLRACYTDAANFTEAFLYHYDAGVYTLLDTYTIGLVGTSGGVNQNAGIITLTSRATDNTLEKTVLPEAVMTLPLHSVYGSLAASGAKTLWNSYTQNTSGNMGNWVCSRSDARVNRTLWYTTALSRKLRKLRGLV